MHTKRSILVLITPLVLTLAAACSSDDGSGTAGGSGAATSTGGSGGGNSGGTGAATTGGTAGLGGTPSGGAAGSGGAGGSIGGTGGVGTGGAGGSGAGGSGALVPPGNDSSHGSGGPAPVAGSVQNAQGIEYRLIVPAAPAKPCPLLVVYSGTEGGAQMTSNLSQLGGVTQSSGFIRAVLDGVQYNGNANAGATVLDDVRAHYDIDNDRTYLLGESAGTTAALKLGFTLRQSYFAAYWANDINASSPLPAQNAAALGFQPWGQVGPGGDFADAGVVVAAMQAAGYRVPTPAPYDGPGANQHGNPNQFIAAVTWFSGKSRQ